MGEFVVRGYRSEDEEDLLAIWNEALPRDPIEAAVFRRKVLLDPNFDPEWLSVGERDGQRAGFCLALIRRVPLESEGLSPDRGWITALAVAPRWQRQGFGDRLLRRALGQFAEAGRREVLVAPYTPNYFVPGVDVERYAGGVDFFVKRGFEVVSRPLSMDANLVKLEAAAFADREERLRADGIRVRALRPHEIPLLLGFLRAHMPADWVRHARDVLLDVTQGLGDYDQFTVALRDGEVVGYCQFEGEHFGPFGVRSDAQGQGIGTVLLARCLETMRRRGAHHAWVLWTSDEAATRVYGKFGFTETRRFAVLRKRLGGDA